MNPSASRPMRLAPLAIAVVVVIVALPLFLGRSDAVRVLFVGNSHVTSNDLAGTLSAIASAGGHRVRPK